MDIRWLLTDTGHSLLLAGLLQAAAVPRDQVEAAFSAMLRDLMHHLGLAEVAAAAA